MRLPLSRLTASCVGGLTALTLVAGLLFAPGAHAEPVETLASTPVVDAPQWCVSGAPTISGRWSRCWTGRR